MQKKIIALAVAGLVSGVAFAQTNVTVYGAIDMAYVHKSDAVSGVNQNAYNALDTNGWDDSWFGLMGTEDLGNGLTASFQMEMGINPDFQNAQTRQRPTFVQLAGKSWGSVKAGNFFIDNVLFNTKGGFDNGGMSEKAIRVGYNTWANNAVNYTSPNWSGFQFNVGYSSNFTWAADDAAQEVNNTRAWFGDVTYSNGGLFVGATYSNFGAGGGNSNNLDGHEWNIGAAYDFKVVNVGLVYDSVRVDNVGFDWIGSNSFIGAMDMDRDTWRLNVGIPIGAKDAVYLSYVNVQTDYSGPGNDFSQGGFGVGYKHNLSKRTSLYAQAYFVDADDFTFDNFKNQTGEVLQNGFQTGIRHTF